MKYHVALRRLYGLKSRANFRFRSHPVPAKTNALGVKGCGEAGCAGSITSVMNAVADALADAGAPPVDMPATPEKVWKALAAARGAAAR